MKNSPTKEANGCSRTLPLLPYVFAELRPFEDRADEYQVGTVHMQTFFASIALVSILDISLGKSGGGTMNITFVVKELMVCSRALRNLLEGMDTSD